MSPVRVFVLVIAAIAAIGMAFLMRGALGGKNDGPAPVVQAAPEKPMARVLVAKRDLAPGARLTSDDMDWQDWPAEGINPAFITDGVPPAPEPKTAKGKAEKAVATATATLSGPESVRTLEGAVVKEPILAGEPIVLRKVVRGGEGGFLSVVLTPGMRAMGVSVSVDTAAGGFILPGDRVDVLQTREVEDVSVTRTVLRNVKVLAIDQSSAPAKDANTLVGATATLEVAAADVEALAGAQAQAKQNGVLALALRSYADAGGPSGRGTSSSGRTGSISVFRGGQASEVTITQ
jgi:pilus assembly protein CpaB